MQWPTGRDRASRCSRSTTLGPTAEAEVFSFVPIITPQGVGGLPAGATDVEIQALTEAFNRTFQLHDRIEQPPGMRLILWCRIPPNSLDARSGGPAEWPQKNIREPPGLRKRSTGR